MVELPFPVRVGEFEGPLDLLLALVQSHQVEIEQIPISEVTRQYLDYLRGAELMHIDLGADFVYMAATLIHIKSRMLLPVDPALSGRAQADPRRELIDRLREHARAKQAAADLRNRMELEDHSWSNPGMSRFVEMMELEPAIGAPSLPRASLADLIDTLNTAVQRARTQTRWVVEPERATVEERLAWFRGRVAGGDVGRKLFGMLVAGQPTVLGICLFLALLELAKSGEVALEQWEEDLWVEPMCRNRAASA
jgi:segregation and condensation protein A